jgi:hypothetical protein
MTLVHVKAIIHNPPLERHPPPAPIPSLPLPPLYLVLYASRVAADASCTQRLYLGDSPIVLNGALTVLLTTCEGSNISQPTSHRPSHVHMTQSNARPRHRPRRHPRNSTSQSQTQARGAPNSKVPGALGATRTARSRSLRSRPSCPFTSHVLTQFPGKAWKTTTSQALQMCRRSKWDNQRVTYTYVVSNDVIGFLSVYASCCIRC